MTRLLLLALFLPELAFAQQGSEPMTKVFLNGVPAPVYFNDGDTFRVLGGQHQGMKGRLGGFNTLETFGPVHRWGTWHAKELYVISKMATQHARQGVWHCESKEFETDTYGRVLWHCRDLMLDMVRRGYAHALSIDYTPSDKELLEAQRDAIENRRGMWAHGVPEYLVTSLHSIDEGGGSNGKTYNRLVSTRDGHSAKWEHTNQYGECEWVCRQENDVSLEEVKEAVEELIVDPKIGADALQLGEEKLLQVVGDYAWLGYFGGVENKSLADALEKKLADMVAAKKLGNGGSSLGSCSLYVIFERRYGATRPECLK
jgi:endonuclease YncB( thermonuclease family)